MLILLSIRLHLRLGVCVCVCVCLCVCLCVCVRACVIILGFFPEFSVNPYYEPQAWFMILLTAFTLYIYMWHWIVVSYSIHNYYNPCLHTYVDTISFGLVAKVQGLWLLLTWKLENGWCHLYIGLTNYCPIKMVSVCGTCIPVILLNYLKPADRHG